MSRTPSPDPRSPGKTDLSGNKVSKFNNGWTKSQEDLMADWADRASCYRWMHDKCEKIMKSKNMWITVPVIILSTLTGSANFIVGSVLGDDQEKQKLAQIAIGGVSIFTGILTTLGNFFRYAQNSEAHRVASISWGKFQRQLDVELKLHPKDRIDCMDFLKICRAEFDRLIEQSPQIPDIVIDAFEKEFEDNKELKKPDIAHGMEHTKVFVDKDTRLKQVAADAAMFLQQKRRVWHRAMMPDVENHVNIKLTKAIEDLSGNTLNVLQSKINELERRLEEKEAEAAAAAAAARPVPKILHFRSFMREPHKTGVASAPIGPLPSRDRRMSLRDDHLPSVFGLKNALPKADSVLSKQNIPDTKDITIELPGMSRPGLVPLTQPDSKVHIAQALPDVEIDGKNKN